MLKSHLKTIDKIDKIFISDYFVLQSFNRCVVFDLIKRNFQIHNTYEDPTPELMVNFWVDIWKFELSTYLAIV